jgi:hypothetical protein
MSEHDNLHKADGTNQKSSAENREENNTSELSKENEKTASEHSTEELSDGKEPEIRNYSEDEEHVDEISASNAEDAEDEDNKERHQIEEEDYHQMSLEALVKSLEKLISNHKIQTISKQVNEIKIEFNTKFNALLEEKKEDFLSDGGNPIDFYYSNDAKKSFNKAYRSYKEQISKYYKERETNLKENLKTRLDIIEEIKGLINVEENINTTYKQFKDLQERWRNAGPIPRDKYNNAWNTYHHHVERFYDFLHLNRDLRDLDFKHNLEQKLKIIDQAKALAKDENINRAFRELQALHKMWKEELGPVAQSEREQIWDRFSAATKVIHQRRQEYYADLEKAYEKNLERKEAIIESIRNLLSEPTNSHGAWQKKIKKLEELRTDFFNAGKVPLRLNEATWTKFKDAVRTFNRSKNQFYKNLKKDQFDNLEKKRELIKIAQDNKDSEDFKTVTPLMKKIQSDWKKIGHVPRKDSDKIWKEFKDACNYYFDRLHAAKKSENQHLYDALDQKKALLTKLKEFKAEDSQEEDLEFLKSKIEEWKSLGAVPKNKRYIEGKFTEVVDEAFSKMDIDPAEAELIKFNSKLEVLKDDGDHRKLDNEQNYIRKKIDEVKSEINQLENNLQFFSNIDEENPVVKDVLNNIERHKDQLEVWKSKLKTIREMYKSE